MTEVVRGRDLLSSSGRQVQLYHALGAPLPTYCHVPLWCDGKGQRLSKRKGDQAQTLGVLRSQGFDAGLIIGTLGRALGVAEPHERLSVEKI